MRLFKLITGCLVLLIIALFIYQNLAAFTALQEFKLNFYFESSSGKIALYALLLLSAAVGFLVGILVVLKPYLGARQALSRETKAKGASSKVEGKSGQNAGAPASAAAK